MMPHQRKVLSPERAAGWFVGAATWGLTALVIAVVVARYVLGSSLVWGEEVARQLLVYITFVGALCPMFAGRLMAFSPDVTPDRPVPLAVRLLGPLASVAFYAGFLVSALSLIDATAAQRTIATGFPIRYIYAALVIFALGGLASVIWRLINPVRSLS